MTIEALHAPKERLHYAAQWPKHLDPALKSMASKVWRIVWNIISIIIFPIGLCRVIGWILHNRLFYHILPGSPVKHEHETRCIINSPWKYTKAALARLFNPGALQRALDKRGDEIVHRHGGQRMTITSPDGTKLDAVYFPGSNNDKAIVYAFGTGQQWESSERMIHYLTRFDTPLLIVNPRGVGRSTGWRYSSGYPLDVYSGHQFLTREKGIDPENILTIGFSMGGGYGTCAAAHLQKEFPKKKIKMINLLSFSALSLEVDTLLKNSGSFLLALPRLASKAFTFGLPAKKAWDTLKGKKCVFYNPKDQVIPYTASMVKSIRDRTLSRASIVRMQPVTDGMKGHNRCFSPSEQAVFDRKILEYLNLSRETTKLDTQPIPPKYVFTPPIDTHPIEERIITPIKIPM